ncbi:MAG: acyltransferase family protein [Atopobiaceae bacterium]|jgi:peptidoglycan/LPS O-acetylase OafA/YrhL|nr:acyltransferase family protein [Atopobiaceae bacterium]
MTKQRTTSIELMRLIAAIGIMIVHFGSIYLGANHIWAPFAYVFVELFFILGGFFMMRHLETASEPMSTGAFLLHKVKGFYSVFIIAFSAQFVLFVITNQVQGLDGYLHSLLHFKWEALLLHCSGAIKDPAFNADYLLGTSWYLSAMMLAFVFVYPLAKGYRKLFKGFIAPVLVILLYAIIIQYYGTLDVGSEYLGIVTLAIMRGVAGVCLGALCWECLQALRDWEPSESVLRALSTMEVLLWLAAILLLTQLDFTTDEDALFYVLVFSGIVVLGFWDKTALAHLLNHHMVRALTMAGRLSLYLYLFHWTVMTAMNLWLPGLPTPWAWALFFAITLGLSLLCMAFDARRKTSKPVLALVAGFLGIALVLTLA